MSTIAGMGLFTTGLLIGLLVGGITGLAVGFAVERWMERGRRARLRNYRPN